MSTNLNFEINVLKEKVSKAYGGRIATTNDFAYLSESINEKTGMLVSDSTLKRLWGYVNYNPHPHTSTLNILSKYIGFNSFREFCTSLQCTSSFFSCEKIITSELSEGDTVCVGWDPDREVRLKYLGGVRFCVLDGGTSKLQQGDIVETSEYLKGQPLFFGKVLRADEELPAYAAGKIAGITKLEMVY